ncbi:MAG: hypothetical protein ACRBN8_39395 [Nannocystales bacterium]
MEWPSADRAQLEARAKTRVVVIRYDGCELEMLPRCEAPGAYAYTSVAPKQDTVHIRNLDELYAEVPAGAVSLEGKLAAAGELTIDMMMVGRLDTDTPVVTANELQGDCVGATHVMTGMTVGAFEFFAGASAEAGVGARVGQVGAGTRGEHVKETLTRDGTLESCVETDAPPKGCSAPLRIEVARLGIPRKRAVASAEPVAATCPEGSRLRDGKCVATQVVHEVSCPKGSHWEGSACVESAATPPGGGAVTELWDDFDKGSGWACYLGTTKNGPHGECMRDHIDCGQQLANRKVAGRLESTWDRCERQAVAGCFQLQVKAGETPRSFCFPSPAICERNLRNIEENREDVGVVSRCAQYR